MDNHDISQLLRNIAAAYEILGENRFRITAYQQAADSIATTPADLKSIWKQNKLGDVPGVGPGIAGHLDELFRTGHVKHFDEIMAKMPLGMFELLKLRGVGPKTAYKLATILAKHYPGKTGILEKLTKALEDKLIQTIEGFGEKSEQDIAESLKQYKRGIHKKKRLLLSEADAIAHDICSYLQKDPAVARVDMLGSLRRKKETIGDIDLACVTSDPTHTLNHFIAHPNVKQIVDQGEKGATILLHNGVQIDLRVATKASYGAMLQYFTGSKYHNIRLREYALSKGLSLSEHGIKKVGKQKIMEFPSEETFYDYIGLSAMPPEMREDRGEIELAKNKQLPHLVEQSDLKGDLHIHSNYDFPVSHDLGRSSLDVLVNQAKEYGYEYIGLSDHNPKQSGISNDEEIAIMKKRKEYFDTLLYKQNSAQKTNQPIKVFIMMEIDIRGNGSLALQNASFEYLDAAIISIHSGFEMNRDIMTKRILTALSSHPKVRILGHPTGRLINQRESIQADWTPIFEYCKMQDIALEINSSAQRLDLPDKLIFEARKMGLKFIIGTDSHHVDQMSQMEYGIAMARRGWCEKSDILNTLPLEQFKKWLMRG